MQSFLLKELCLPVCCEHAQNQAGLYSLTCPRWCLFLLSMPQSLHPHKACLISHHQPTLITLFSTFKDISEQTERGRVRAVPSIAITVVSSRVQCVSQCSRERTKNRKPTSQALCFPRQGLRSAAQPHWDRCHLPEHHHPRDLLSSPRATGSVPGIQMLCLSPGWYWWSSNKSEKQRQGPFSSLSHTGGKYGSQCSHAVVCPYIVCWSSVSHLHPQRRHFSNYRPNCQRSTTMTFAVTLVLVPRGWISFDLFLYQHCQTRTVYKCFF